MPVFNVSFDISKLKSGASDAIKYLGKVSDAVDGVDKAFSTLNIRSKDAIVSDIKSVVYAFREIKSSSESSAKEVQRARKAMIESLRELSKEARGIADFPDIKPKVDSASQSFSRLEKSVKSAGAYFATFFAVDKLLSMGKALLDASIAVDRLNKSYQSIEGSAGLAQEKLDFVYSTSQELGLSFISTAESAKVFFAAAKGTSLEKDMDRIFKSVSQAGTALSLSTEQMSGVFLAFTQIISKGRVQQEEILQIAERFPGTYQMVADALGKSTTELVDFIAKGNVTADELLPKLADQFENKFAVAAENAANGIQQSINKMDNEWTVFKANLLESEPIVSAINMITGALQGLNAAMGERDLEKRMEAAGWQRTEVTDFRKSTYKLYTEEQKKIFLEYEKILREQEKAEADVTTQQKVEIDKRLKASSAANAAYEKIFSTTKEGQIKAAQDAYTSTVTLQKTALEQGAITQAEYDKRIAALAQARDEKITAINKRGSNTRLSDAEKEAKKFSESTAQYESSLKKLRNEVGAMDDALDPSLTKFEKLRKQIEAERDAAIENADVTKEETIRRKQATTAQAEQVAELTKRKAVLEANKKLEELENQNLQEKAEFYKQLSEKTGEYSSSISYQNQLLEKQRQVWVAMGIPIEDVNKMLEILSLELSRDPWAGAYRGLTRYRIETENLAASFESLTTGTLTGIEDAFVKMAETGKLSFRDLANSIISDLMRIAVRMSITGPLAGALGSGLSSLFNFGGGTTTTSVMGNSISSGWASSFMGGLNLFASGGVASPSWGLPSSGGLLTRPTYFHDGMNRAYARGGLSVAGEAGPEVFMPAVPMSDGKYGVRVQGMGSSSPVVNVTVINNAGAQVETNQRQNDDGSLDVEIMIDQMVTRSMVKRSGGASNVLRKGYGMSMIPTSR